MQTNWARFAIALATFAQRKMAEISRGALLVRCTGDGNLVLGAFGNDDYLFDEKAQREVQLLRDLLRKDGVRELGFGLSLDGRSWAVVIDKSGPIYRTVAGKLFQMELLKAELQDRIEESWKTVSCQGQAGPDGRPSVEQAMK